PAWEGRGEAPPGRAGGRSEIDQTTWMVPCIQGWTAQRKCSVVPAGAVTGIEIVLCVPCGEMAMLSPTVLRPGRPLFSTKWTTVLVSDGGAFGFLRCPVASCWQTRQLKTWPAVFGILPAGTIVMVCGSSCLLPYQYLRLEPE